MESVARDYGTANGDRIMSGSYVLVGWKSGRRCREISSMDMEYGLVFTTVSRRLGKNSFQHWPYKQYVSCVKSTATLTQKVSTHPNTTFNNSTCCLFLVKPA